MRTVPVDAAIDERLPARPDAPAAARRALEAVGGLVADEVLDDARLVVTELVANAVRHAGLEPGAPIALRVRLTGASLRVEVEDGGLGLPDDAANRVARSETDVSGRGLLLVARLSRRWAFETGEGGTRVWSELRGPGTAA